MFPGNRNFGNPDVFKLIDQFTGHRNRFSYWSIANMSLACRFFSRTNRRYIPVSRFCNHALTGCISTTFTSIIKFHIANFNATQSLRVGVLDSQYFIIFGFSFNYLIITIKIIRLSQQTRYFIVVCFEIRNYKLFRYLIATFYRFLFKIVTLNSFIHLLLHIRRNFSSFLGQCYSLIILFSYRFPLSFLSQRLSI